MIFNIMLQAVIYCCKGFFFLHLDVGLLIKMKKKIYLTKSYRYGADVRRLSVDPHSCGIPSSRYYEQISRPCRTREYIVNEDEKYIEMIYRPTISRGKNNFN